MNFLYPRFPPRLIPRLLLIAALGAMVGGLYGVIHDQITFSISPEYFTRLKFHQFRYADFGFPERVLAGEVGFIAVGAVGFFAGWFLARVAVPAWPFAVALRRCGLGFGVILAFAGLALAIGDLMGRFHSPDYAYWTALCEGLGVDDIPAFARVGIIHNAGYLGGVAGLIAAVGILRRMRERDAVLAAMRKPPLNRPA